MSSGRMLCLATLFIAACIVALGIGLGVVFTRKLDEISSNKCMGAGSEADVTTTRNQPAATTTPSSQTGSIEGKYRYAAIASDADQICSTIGTYVHVYSILGKCLIRKLYMYHGFKDVRNFIKIIKTLVY